MFFLDLFLDVGWFLLPGSSASSYVTASCLIQIIQKIALILHMNQTMVQFDQVRGELFHTSNCGLNKTQNSGPNKVGVKTPAKPFFNTEGIFSCRVLE